MPSKMNTISILFLLFSMLSQSLLIKAATIDAAYTSGLYTYFISGDEYVKTLDKKQEGEAKSIKELGLPETATVEAATKDHNGILRLFYKNNNKYHPGDYDVKKIPDLIKQGIDAAGSRLGTEYFFKGCDYGRKWGDYWLKSTKRFDKNGVPCNLDAAWADGHSLMFLKGNNLWEWGVSGVEGPKKFNETFTITAWD